MLDLEKLMALSHALQMYEALQRKGGEDDILHMEVMCAIDAFNALEEDYA